MAGKIFINYRRDDDPGTTGRLFDRLRDAFEREQLFYDIDNIAPGLDFVRVLNEHVAACDVLLAVIGRNWIDARNPDGDRRLDDPSDFVHIEIVSALSQNKRVIPVLIGEVRMPRADELPEALRPLATRNAVRLTYEQFDADTQRLIKALQQILETAPTQAKEEISRHPRTKDAKPRQNAAIAPAETDSSVISTDRNNFRAALIVAIAVFLTLSLMIVAVWLFVKFTDDWVRTHIGARLFGEFDPDNLFFHGADGVLIALLALLLLAFFTVNQGRKLIAFTASILSRAPVARPIYRTTYRATEQIVQKVLSHEHSKGGAVRPDKTSESQAGAPRDLSGSEL